MWSLCTKSVSYIKYPKACQQGELGGLPRSRFLAAVWGLSDLVTAGSRRRGSASVTSLSAPCPSPARLLKLTPDPPLFHP